MRQKEQFVSGYARADHLILPIPVITYFDAPILKDYAVRCHPKIKCKLSRFQLCFLPYFQWRDVRGLQFVIVVHLRV